MGAPAHSGSDELCTPRTSKGTHQRWPRTGIQPAEVTGNAFRPLSSHPNRNSWHPTDHLHALTLSRGNSQGSQSECTSLKDFSRWAGERGQRPSCLSSPSAQSIPCTPPGERPLSTGPGVAPEHHHLGRPKIHQIKFVCVEGRGAVGVCPNTAQVTQDPSGNSLPP